MKYADYLKSPQWKMLRQAARERAGGQCELCGGPPEHVHHVTYPKRFEDDHIDNLVVACESCHGKVHGVRREKIMITDLQIFPYEGLHGAHKIRTKMHNGNPIVSFEDVVRVFEIETGMMGSSRNRKGYGAGNSTRAAIDFVKPHEKIPFEVDDPRCPGARRIETFITEPALYRIIFSSSTPEAIRFQEWVCNEVLPAIRKNGRYDMTETGSTDLEQTGDVELDQWNAIAAVARAGAEQRKQIFALSWKVAVLDEERQRDSKHLDGLQKKHDETVKKLDLLTGGNFYRTARFRLIELGINPKKGLPEQVGYNCSKLCRTRHIALPPQIQEGSYMVNQYPVEVIDEVIKGMGILDQGSLFH